MANDTKEMQAVINLPAPQRYRHFIKWVVGWKKMWGLYADGWAMSGTDDGKQVMPLWPEREYAERCIGAEWVGFQPRAITLENALLKMIPQLREQGIAPGVFFTPEHGSIQVTLDEFEKDLREELNRYA